MSLYKCTAREQITVSSAVKTLTAATIVTKQYAQIQVQDAQVYASTNGTDPSATVGRIYNPGDIFEVWGTPDMANFKALRVSSDAVLDVEYFE